MDHIICRFEKKPQGLICRQPHDGAGVVFIDRQSEASVLPDVRYLCKVVRTLRTGERFVQPLRTVDQILMELSHEFVDADWIREDRHIIAVVTTTQFGAVRSMWYETKGSVLTRAMHLEFRIGTTKVRLGCDESDLGVDMARIAERVHACVKTHR